VKVPQSLCGGRVGTSGKGCLKSIGECDVEAHERSKCNFPSNPFLVEMVNNTPTRGYEHVVLETTGLDNALVSSLLEKTEINWITEFEQIRTNATKSIQDLDISKEVLQTARKQKGFKTPGKGHVVDDFEDKLQDLRTISTLVAEMTNLDLDENNQPIKREFNDVSNETIGPVLDDLFTKIDILSEHAQVVKDTLVSNISLIKGHVDPLESVVSGMKLDVAAIRGDLGLKDLSQKTIPPGTWKAIEMLYADTMEIEKKLSACVDRADQAYEVSEYLLEESGKTAPDSKDKRSDSPDSNRDEKDFVFKNILDKPKSSSPDSSAKKPFDDGGDDGHGDCDVDATKCSICMNRMDGIENRLVNSLLRLSNLEESKAGSIESAIMVKNEVFRGRNDISAWCDKFFPEESDAKIECGCFPTPHYILNLMYADMCSKRHVAIELQMKDFKTFAVSRPDATAYYSLQADKPDFMLATSSCPSHSVKVSKAVKEAAPFIFIPSFADFGSSSDTDSMQHRFKKSLEHTQDKQEKYIESRLDGQSRTVIDIANQLLSDSCKFIRQMLDFMEELYTACHDSFGASTEAWELVCHCLEELFTKELKPSLKFCVSQDLNDSRNAFVGALHSAFSLNVKVRELNLIGLKNHHSTTTSHVRFVMKMSKSARKGGDDKLAPLQTKFDKLQSEHSKLKDAMAKEHSMFTGKIKGFETRLDRLLTTVEKLSEKSSGK
jgi:hypothetical protein